MLKIIFFLQKFYFFIWIFPILYFLRGTVSLHVPPGINNISTFRENSFGKDIDVTKTIFANSSILIKLVLRMSIVST